MDKDFNIWVYVVWQKKMCGYFICHNILVTKFRGISQNTKIYWGAKLVLQDIEKGEWDEIRESLDEGVYEMVFLTLMKGSIVSLK